MSIAERVRRRTSIMGITIFIRKSHHFPRVISDVLFAWFRKKEFGTNHPRNIHSNSPIVTKPNSAMK